MENELILKGASAIFNALNNDGIVLVGGVQIEAVRVKKGRLLGYSFSDKRTAVLDLTDKEVARYQKLEALYSPPTGAETISEVATA